MKLAIYTSLLALFLLSGCAELDDAAVTEESARHPSGLTSEQLEKGIGPVSQVSLGPLDGAMAEKGQAIFDSKCFACHKMDERFVGPALGDVLERRTPEFVMNMILNPDEMVKKHPEVQKMLAEYYTPMTFQNVTEEDARAILEYLRQQAGQSTAGN